MPPKSSAVIRIATDRIIGELEFEATDYYSAAARSTTTTGMTFAPNLTAKRSVWV